MRVQRSAVKSPSPRPSFKFTDALKTRVINFVQKQQGTPLDKKPNLAGFHRTKVRVFATTTGSISIFAWYNPSSRQLVRERVSSSRLSVVPHLSTTWSKVGKLPAPKTAAAS